MKTASAHTVMLCGLLFSPAPLALAGDALPQLIDAAGHGPPAVPPPPSPTNVSPQNPSGRPNENAQDAERKKKLEVEARAAERKKKLEAEARAAEQTRLNQAADQARAQWAADDSAAFTGIFDASNGADLLSAPTAPAPPAEATKGETREELLADLVSLRGKVEETKNQLLRLNQAIQSNTMEFDEWEKASNEGIDNIWEISSDLVFVGADKLAKHYRELKRLGKLQHKSTADLRYALRRLRLMAHTKNVVDAEMLAAREHTTPVDILETFVGMVGVALSELDMPPANQLLNQEWSDYVGFAGPSLTYLKAISDTAYTVWLYHVDLQAVERLNRSNEGFKLALEKLSARMSTLVKDLKNTEARLKDGPTERKR